MKLPFFLATRARLGLAIAVGLLLPLALLAALVVTRSHQTLLREARGQSERVALLAARTVEEHFRALERLAESYARRPDLAAAIRAGAPERVRSHLAELVREDSTIDRAFVADPSGVELYDHPPVPAVIGVDFSYRDWFEGVSRARATYTSEVYRRAAPPRHRLVAVATPVRDARGELLGYLVAQRTVHELATWLRELPRRHGSRVWLFGRSGGLATAEGPEEGSAEPSPAAGAPAARGRGVRTAREPDPFSGEPSLVSTAGVPALGGQILVSRPLSAVLAPANALERWIYGLSALAALAMTALGFLWLNTVRRQHLRVLELGARKDTLTHMIVHDIRNPLSAARMALEAEASGEVGPRMRAELDAALQRIEVLVENLLDVTKLEEGVMALDRQPTDVAGLVAHTAETYRDAGRRTGVEVSAPRGPKVEAEVDRALTTRIVENLLLNAMKHTPPGGVVRAEVREEPGGITLQVSDTGEGIPAEEIPRIFEKFGRVAGQRGSSRRDTGLGLVFCRMAAERHGGTIEVESEPERGSTFRVRLPRRAGSPEEGAPPPGGAPSSAAPPVLTS